jgi:hypothetical protein
MVQQGQTIELTRRGADGRPLWAYRYRTGGRDSKRVQRGGFASEQDARDARELPEQADPPSTDGKSLEPNEPDAQPEPRTSL